MKYIILGILLSSFASANPVKKANLLPSQEEAVIPGTQVPVEKINTAPTPTPTEEENEDFRNTLKARKQKQEQIEDKKLYKKNP